MENGGKMNNTVYESEIGDVLYSVMLEREESAYSTWQKADDILCDYLKKPGHEAIHKCDVIAILANDPRVEYKYLSGSAFRIKRNTSSSKEEMRSVIIAQFKKKLGYFV